MSTVREQHSRGLGVIFRSYNRYFETEKKDLYKLHIRCEIQVKSKTPKFRFLHVDAYMYTWFLNLRYSQWRSRQQSLENDVAHPKVRCAGCSDESLLRPCRLHWLEVGYSVLNRGTFCYFRGSRRFWGVSRRTWPSADFVANPPAL